MPLMFLKICRWAPTLDVCGWDDGFKIHWVHLISNNKKMFLKIVSECQSVFCNRETWSWTRKETLLVALFCSKPVSCKRGRRVGNGPLSSVFSNSQRRQQLVQMRRKQSPLPSSNSFVSQGGSPFQEINMIMCISSLSDTDSSGYIFGALLIFQQSKKNHSS